MESWRDYPHLWLLFRIDHVTPADDVIRDVEAKAGVGENYDTFNEQSWSNLFIEVFKYWEYYLVNKRTLS